MGEPKTLFPSSSQTFEFSKISINVPVFSFSFKNHSCLNVSLTYLRGLEVAELKEQDMPMVK